MSESVKLAIIIASTVITMVVILSFSNNPNVEKKKQFASINNPIVACFAAAESTAQVKICAELVNNQNTGN